MKPDKDQCLDTIERRKGDKPVPDNLVDILNDFQLQALRRLESIGYKLMFVRRPLFQDVVAVVSHPQEHKIGMLKEDGAIDFYPDIHFRNWDSEQVIQKLELVANGDGQVLSISAPKNSSRK